MRAVLFTAIILCCACVIVQRGYTADTSMVLYLSLDENAGKIAYDLSSYKNDATLKGNAKWAPGKFNSGIELGVGNYLEVKDSDSLDMTKSLTVSCWVKIIGVTADHQSGIEKGTAWASGEYNLLHLQMVKKAMRYLVQGN